MARSPLLLSVALLGLLCAPALLAAPAEGDLPSSAALEVEGPQVSAASDGEQEAPPAEEPVGIEDLGKDFGELLVPKPIPAFCPHNEPCLGGFFCEEFQKCPVPSCVNGKCRYE